MNILQISTNDRSGGAERIALTLHRQLNQNGHDARLAVGTKATNLPKVIEFPNRAARPLVPRLAYALPLWMRRANVKGAGTVENMLMKWVEPGRSRRLTQGYEDFDYPGTAKIIAESGFVPDVLHAHNLHGKYFDLRVLPELSHTAPFLITLHDTWLMAGHCAYSLDCQNWRTGCGSCPYLSLPVAIPADNTAANWKIKRDIYARSNLYIVGVAQFLLDRMKDSMLQPRISRVIHNGVDASTFRPARDVAELKRKWRMPENSRVVMFAATDAKKNPWKDFASFQATMEIMTAKYAGPEKLIFLCVGASGEKKIMGNCEMMFTGYLKDQASMAECYQLSDLYLHTTKADSFPNVIMEAMASGTPSIASSIGGIPEQIRDGFNGFLCRPGDAMDVAEKSIAALGNREFLAQMGSNGRSLVMEKFLLEHQTRNYLDFYEEISEDFLRVSRQKAAVAAVP